MKYIPPEVGDNNVIYKGKRYWIVEFSGKDKIDGFGSENCQFIMYDKDRNGILAYIDMKNGEYFATLAWGIDNFTKSFSNIKDVVQGVVDMDRYYAKHCFG
jgi:hypothetical protein